MCPPFVSIFKEECAAVGVNWLVVWCQFVLETGFAKSALYKDDWNMFGLKTNDASGQESLASFRSARYAIRAGAQHLAIYAGTNAIRATQKQNFVLERTAKLIDWGFFGIVKNLDELGGNAKDGKIKWSSDIEYGKKLTVLYESILAFSAKDNPNPKEDSMPQKPLPVPAPEIPPPAKLPSKEIPPEKIKLPWIWKIALKAAVKYGGALLVGLIAGLSPPVAAVITLVWKAIEAWVASL